MNADTALDSYFTGEVAPLIRHPAARRRGRPKCPYRAALEAGGRRAKDCPSINRELLDAMAAEVAERRRQILRVHRGDRRDEEQIARRAALAPEVQRHGGMSAASVSAYLLRTWPLGPSMRRPSDRTLREDIRAIRKAGNGSPTV
jgi:hypothetical protein